MNRHVAIDPLEQALADMGSREQVLQRQNRAFGEISDVAMKVVIAGCGHLGKMALSGARAAGLEIAAFADNDAARWGGTLDGIPVMSPADAVSKHNLDAFFVVAIYNPSA